MASVTFDFITAREFRESLERDYAEMRACFSAEAWKSVQVLAGSIVEALLIDYLASTAQPARPQKDPLRLDLAEAIALCKAEKAISDRTADLCSVIRSYRNLIHPGRAVRLAEQQASAKSAQIAVSVVDLIVDDIAQARRSSVGLTAEQVMSKIRKDENSLGILQHLVKEVSERQQERLLLELLPEAYFSLYPATEPWDQPELDRLAGAYRIVFDGVTDDLRRKAVTEFVRVLREEDGNKVNIYTNSFFKTSDLKFVAVNHAAMVRQHLLRLVPSMHTAATLRLVDGIAEYLEPSEVQAWLDPFVRTLISPQASTFVKSTARGQLLSASMSTSGAVDTMIDSRFDDWIPHLEKNSSAEQAAIIRKLKEEIESMRPPF
mgnify:CR=1 FL=1